MKPPSVSQYRFHFFSFLRTYAEGLLFTVIVALLLRQFVVTPFRVIDREMEPSYQRGDYLLGYRPPYGAGIPFLGEKSKKLPKKGELIVFKCPNRGQEKCLRRVVALPGDRVEVVGERLIINGETAGYQLIRKSAAALVFEETIQGHRRDVSFDGSGNKPSFGPVVVAPSSVFVLSDNRDLGNDSRQWGSISADDIEARASMIWFSLKWPDAPENSRWPSVQWGRLFTSPR